MSLHNAQFEINAMLKIEPKLERIIGSLESYVNAFHVTNGSAIPAMIGAEYQHLPVLFIASKRMRNAWVESCAPRGAHITVDGCGTGFGSTSYLTWSAAEFSFGIDTFELDELFSAGQSSGKVLVIWVADTLMTLDSFSVDDEFLDFLHSANQSRHIPRFIPGQDYIDSKIAEFPPLMSSDEQRFIGAAGEPVYLVAPCDVKGSDLQAQLDLAGC